jgi:acyl carrier protein
MDDIRPRLEDVFREVFGDASIELHDEMTAEDFPEWDSVHHVDLLIAIESAFGVHFSTAEMARLKRPGQNVGTLVHLVQDKLAAQ